MKQGRPPKDGETMNHRVQVRIPHWMAKALDKIGPNRSEAARACIEEALTPQKKETRHAK